MNIVNRRELVTTISGHTDLDKKTVDTVLHGFVEVVSATIAKGDPVSLPGFAKFARVDRKARMGRNPQTGEPVKIKASKKARITPLKGLKEVIAGRSTAPRIKKPRATPVKAAAKKVAAKQTTATRATATRTAATKATAKRTPVKRTPAKRAPAKRVAKR